jgi:CRP-like cAMP-binding protein
VSDSESGRNIRPRLALVLEGWHLPSEFIGRLLAYHSRVSYEKGAVLFASGSPCDIFFLVFDGAVRVYATQPEGGQTTFMLAGPGDFLGLANSSDRDRRVHCLDASALTKCSVALFTRRHLLQLLKNLTPATLIRLIEDMNIAWSRALFWQVNFLRLSFRERFELVLHGLSSKFGLAVNNGIIIDLKLGQGDFAEIIGSSRPVVGKLFAEMFNSGEIELTKTGKILLREPFARPNMIPGGEPTVS